MSQRISAVPMKPAAFFKVPKRLMAPLIGFMIIAVAPTLFWIGMLRVLCWSLNIALPMWVVGMVGLLIFALLTCIWASFTMAGRSDADGA